MSDPIHEHMQKLYDRQVAREWKRMDRAAQCLPHCDPGRLRSLLRAEIRTEVL